MTFLGILQFVLILGALLLTTKPLGHYMAKVMDGERTFLSPLLSSLEKWIYRLSGVDPSEEMSWQKYSSSVLLFSLAGAVILYTQLRLQDRLPLNRDGMGPLAPDLAFNTAASFLTNTNWQAYSGESTLSYFVQMAALTVQNFVSAAAGLAIAIAVVRGFARHEAKTLGNFWVDVTRAILYVLLPISFVAALFLCSQGVIQNLKPYTTVTTVEGATQTIAQGPVASQEAIKELGTNGGGFFGANSAHPFENPSPLTNFVQTLLIFVIPAGLTYMFGVMVGDRRQGWAIFAACSVMFLSGVFVCYWAEQHGNPTWKSLGVENSASTTQPGGNMEGKETRFGIAASALFATITTDASCGAVNSMHDSFLPIAGLVPLINLMTDIVIFGGVGAGLYGILIYAIIAVFIAGLMVGRTPEYLGKKLEQKEVKMAMLAIIVTSMSVLVFSALATQAHFAAKGYWNAPGAAIANMTNSGPHGFAEILYAYTSATGNNGSAFGGLSANTPWYNLTLGLAMLLGRF